MPDAVIVGSARTPVGRAHKGSLVDARADDLAASAVRAALDKVPGLAPETTRMAFHAIRAGEGDAFLSAGAESVSRYRPAPEGTDHPDFAAAQERTSRRAQGGDGVWRDPREAGELPDYYIPMGQTAENVAEHSGITRAGMGQGMAIVLQRVG